MTKEDENIEFEMMPDMEAPPIDDPNDEKEKILKDLSQKYEKKRAEEEFRKAQGIEEPKKKEDQVPAEVPDMLFKMGSKAIECDKFKLSPDEAKIITAHLNNLLPKFDSKILSAVIILIVIISKIISCTEAIKSKISGFRQNKDLKYNETTESMEGLM